MFVHPVAAGGSGGGGGGSSQKEEAPYGLWDEEPQQQHQATTVPKGRSTGAHGDRVRYEMMMMTVKSAFTTTIFDN